MADIQALKKVFAKRTLKIKFGEAKRGSIDDTEAQKDAFCVMFTSFRELLLSLSSEDREMFLDAANESIGGGEQMNNLVEATDKESITDMFSGMDTESI